MWAGMEVCFGYATLVNARMLDVPILGEGICGLSFRGPRDLVLRIDLLDEASSGSLPS